MARPICQGTRKSGDPCRAPALPGSLLCWLHDPDKAEQVAEARSRGGVKGSKVKALKSHRRKIDTHAGLAAFLAGVIHDAVEGKITTDVAKTVIYGCSVMRHLIDHDVIKRLDDIERRLNEGTVRTA